MVRNIELYVEYEFNNSGTMSYGSIGESVCNAIFSDGTLCGKLLEYDMAAKFNNLTKKGCEKRDGPDLLAALDDEGETVQCKCLRLLKTSTRKGKKFLTEKMSHQEAGTTTKSTLWDTNRKIALGRNGEPTKEHYTVWDEKHQTYFSNYKYFMYFVIDDHPRVRMIMIPTKELFQHSDVERQIRKNHFDRNGQERYPGTPVPQWDWPVFVTPAMYFGWIKRREVYSG